VTSHPSKEEIAGTAMLEAGDPDRARVEAHAASCEACGKEWRRATKLASLMGTLATPPPANEKALARTRARVHALLATDDRSPRDVASPISPLALAAAVVVSVVAAFSVMGPSSSISRALLSLTTIGVAALLPGFALRSPSRAKIATAFTLALSFVLAFVDYSVLTMIDGHTVGCLQIEMVIGALPLVAMVAMSRRADPMHGAWQSAAAGAAGALAGQGVLLTTCASDESVMHVLAYHVTGVLAAALLGGGLGRAVARGA
jgi:hypothetical protein